MQKTVLEDNDAAGRIYYQNFFRELDVLSSLRHGNYRTYKNLILLAKDFKNKAKIFTAVQRTSGLKTEQLNQFVNNTIEAASILQDSCRQGRLSFDLDYELYLKSNMTPITSRSCE
jgi:hypothetical protein